jgi:hypothetical protein
MTVSESSLKPEASAPQGWPTIRSPSTRSRVKGTAEPFPPTRRTANLWVRSVGGNLFHVRFQHEISVACGVNMIFADDSAFEGREPMYAELRVDVLHVGHWIAGDVKRLSTGDPLVTDALNAARRQPDSGEGVPASWLFVPCSTDRVATGAHNDFLTTVEAEAARILSGEDRGKA